MSDPIIPPDRATAADAVPRATVPGPTIALTGGSVVRDGTVVGAWWRDPPPSSGVAAKLKVAWRTAANEPRAVDVDLRHVDDPSPGMVGRVIAGDATWDGRRLSVRDWDFRAAVLHAATQSRLAEMAETPRWADTARRPGRQGPDPSLVCTFRAFLHGLDPDAVEGAVSGDIHAEGLASWAGIDATFIPGAPLRVALAQIPGLGATLASAWRSDRAAFVTDVARADVWAIVTRELAGSDLPRWLVAALPDAVRWPTPAEARVPEGLDGTFEAFMRGVTDDLPGDPDVLVEEDPLGTPAGRSRGLPRDMVLSDVEVLALLPADRLPRGDQWLAFRECQDMVRAVEARVGGEHLDAALGLLGGDWRGWSAGLPPPEGRPGTIRREVRDLPDHAVAYARQVVIPALRLMGEDTGLRLATDVAFATLHSGRVLRSWFGTSRRWHVARTTVDAVVAGLPGRQALDPPWGPCLPDHEDGPLSVRVLTTARALAAEGAWGGDGDGMAGLDHCVGGYASWCRSGGSRILGVLRTLPDGTRERLSTVEVRFGPDGSWAVAQHRGTQNSEPDAEAVDFLARYVRSMRMNPDHIHLGDLEPVPEPVDDLCGYDWRHPGNWEAVRDAWSPLVPRALRDMAPAGFVELDAHLTRMPRGRTWLPRPVTSALDLSEHLSGGMPVRVAGP